MAANPGKRPAGDHYTPAGSARRLRIDHTRDDDNDDDDDGAAAAAGGAITTTGPASVLAARNNYDPVYDDPTCPREDRRSEYVTDHPLEIYDRSDPGLCAFVDKELRDARDRLVDVIPVCNGEVPWIEEFKPSHAKSIHQFLIGIFAVWCRCAVGIRTAPTTAGLPPPPPFPPPPFPPPWSHGGHDDETERIDGSGSGSSEVNANGTWRAVRIYGPPIVGGISTDARSSINVMYQDPSNPVVYHESALTIGMLIQEFVRTLFRARMFTPGTIDYLVPPDQYPDLVSSLEKQLLGVGAKLSVPLHGNILVDDKKDAVDFMIESVGNAVRTRVAIGTGLLTIPKPIGLMEWGVRILRPERKPDETSSEYADRCRAQQDKSVGWLPQIHFKPTLGSDDKANPPYIRDCRHFELSPPDQTRFKELVQTVNGAVKMYRDFIGGDTKRSLDEKQQWVADFVWGLVNEYVPNTTSLAGVQYCQRTCVKLQADCYRDENHPAGIGRPRAFFAGNPAYVDDVSPDERRLVAAFFDTAGMVLFSHETYMCGFVGQAGAGKTLITGTIVRLVGSPYAFRIDSKHNNWSMAMYRDTFVLMTEDQKSKKLAISTDITDGIVGSVRNDPEEINIQTK